VRRRSFHALPGALALALVLASCGGSSGSTTASTAPAPASRTATSTMPTAAAPGRSSPSRRPAHARPARSSAKPKRRGPTVLTYGAEASPSRRSGAAQVLHSYLEARARGEWPVACSYLAVPERRQVEALTAASGRGEGCPGAYAALYAAAPASQRANPFAGLSALRVKGRHGSAVFLSSSGAGYVMPLVSEGGSWRLTQISPFPYPPASRR
jgi:hypothetical protein